MAKNFKRLLFVFAVMAIMIAALAMTVSAEVFSVTEKGSQLTFDSESGVMEITFTGNPADYNWWWEFQPSVSNELGKFIETHRKSVKHIEFDFYKRIQCKESFLLFEGMESLVSVHFKDDGAGNGPNFHDSVKNMFKDCKALTTVWVGDAKEENAVDLSKLTTNDPFNSEAFANCNAMKKLVLMDSANVTELSASMFAGCSSLESVVIPESVKTIADDTFSSVETLKSVIAPFGSFAQAFASANGLFPTIWDRKPATEPVSSGYCTSGLYNNFTNCKWELHNIGTASNVEYALYFYIDLSSSNASASYVSTHLNTVGTVSGTGNGYGWANSNGAERNHPWYDESTFESIKYISIDEGIKWFEGATFVGMSSVEVIELPVSMAYYEGPHFKNMSGLTTVYTRGNAFEVGTVDISGINAFKPWNSMYMFAGLSSVKKYNLCSNWTQSGSPIDETDFMNNTALEEVIFTQNGGLTTIGANAFVGCPSLKKLVIPDAITSIDPSAFPDSKSVEWVEASVGSAGHAFALSKGWNTNNTVKSAYYPDNAILTFNDGHVTILPNLDINPGWAYQVAFGKYDPNISAFLNAYAPYIESIYVGNFGKFSVWDSYAFANMPKLTEVGFESNIPLCYETGGRIFVNCPALETVYFGGEANRVEGVADFSGTVFGADKYNVPTLFIDGILEGCNKVTKVVLPDAAYAINANSFYGCTSLEEITIPASVTGIADGAFSTCTALRKINLAAPASIVTAGSVSGAKGLVIFAQSAEDADTINANLAAGSVSTSTAFAFYKTGMDIIGYSVRIKDYNGLRTHYCFNAEAVSGYELVEYGSIVATKDNWNLYSESFGADDSLLVLNGEDFVTPATNVIKTSIWQNGAYVNNSVDTENGRSFSVTVTKFVGQDQIKAELVSAGYEIWKKGDSYFVIYTREDSYGYDSISLYKTTMGMLKDNAISVSMDETDPIWGTLNVCEKTEIELSDEGVVAYKFADPINNDNFIAVYLTANETETELSYLGIDSDEKDSISAYVFGKNVNYNLPIVDGYWETHLEEQIAQIPKGKSFIAFTDTHYQSNDLPLESGVTRNNRKLPDLIEYVRKKTGISTVLNLGDPYSGEEEVELAAEMMKISVYDDFYGNFGSDALFAVGNHDANKTAEGSNGDTAYDFLLPDTVIYEYGFKPLEGKVVWDTDMIALADELDYTSAIANTNNKFTEEQFKAEFIAWAKQHYHYDDTSAKIRYISINTGNCGIVEQYLFDGMLYGAVLPAQYDWLYNVLTTTPEGYDIVIMGHMFGSNIIENQSAGWFFYFLSAFSGGYSQDVGGMNGGSANRNLLYGNPEGTEYKKYDFSEFGAFDGTIFTLGGHWHSNMNRVWGGSGKNVDYVEGNSYQTNDLFIISIAEDGLDSPDQLGYISENGFAIVTITEDNRIVITGIGDVSSRTLKH